MATQEQLRALTPLVLEAQAHCRWHTDNNNPSLGKAIVLVDELLIHDLRTEADDDIDVENLVADAGAKVFAMFHSFRGTTGAELYGWIRKIVVHAIENIKRRREAQAKRGLRYSRPAAEARAEAARLMNLLESREVQPDEAAITRETVTRLRRALRTLSFDQLRVARLVMDDVALREIAASFGRSLGWVQDIWESAKHHLRIQLTRRRASRRPACAA